jgi:hypothetical protein
MLSYFALNWFSCFIGSCPQGRDYGTDVGFGQRILAPVLLALVHNEETMH